jgi:hypothetical protein
MQGVKGEAVVIYAESLTTQQMRHHLPAPGLRQAGRLSQRVNNSANIITFLELITCAFVPSGR